MIIKIFTCPECRYRKFETLANLNVHIGKSHQLDYKITEIKNGKPIIKRKLKISDAEYVN